MTPAAIIQEAAADGVSLVQSPAGTIKAVGDEVAVNRWLPVIREHKRALLEALAQPDPLPPVPRGLGGYGTPPGVPSLGDCKLARQIAAMPEDDHGPGAEASDLALWWRVGITEPGGRTIEVDTPSGWALANWQAYATRYHGPGCAVTPIAGLPKPRAPIKLDEALRAACEGVAGITPAQFRALLAPEDIKDIEAGGIHPRTLHAYAESFAEGIRSGRIAALPERKGAKPGPASGSIVITDAEIGAARKGQREVRQGEFTGEHEVKP